DALPISRSQQRAAIGEGGLMAGTLDHDLGARRDQGLYIMNRRRCGSARAHQNSDKPISLAETFQAGFDLRADGAITNQGETGQGDCRHNILYDDITEEVQPAADLWNSSRASRNLKVAVSALSGDWERTASRISSVAASVRSRLVGSSNRRRRRK